MIIIKGQTLQRQVVVATSIMLLALAGAVLWSGNRTRLEHQDELRVEAHAVAALAAAYLNQYFDGLDSTASALARHPAVTSFDAVNASRVFAELMREQPLLLNVALRDRNGVLRASGVDSPTGPSTPAPPYLVEVLKTGRPAVGEMTTAPVTGKPTIAQAYPVRDASGSVIGALGFGLNLIQLQKVLEKLPLPDGSVVTLLDKRGFVLARSRDGEKYIGVMQQPLVTAADGVISQTERDGVDRFIGTASIQGDQWEMTAGIPQSVVVDRLGPMYQRNIGLLGTFVLATLGLALWLSRHVSSGLNRLRVAALRIAEGDLSPPTKASSPSLEILEVQDAFSEMAANLRDARSALALQIEQERKTSEMLQSIQRQMVRQERLAAVGLLASGVAHELNNPLQAILGTAEVLERNPGLPADTLEEISLLKTQSGRAREIIRSLSRFSSPQPEPPALVDLRAVIAEVIQLKARDLEKASIALDVETTATRQVFANMTEVEQVTINFVINAQQAIEGAGHQGGRILIRLHEVEDKVRLEVHDDGEGVPAGDEQKLFQPFFTTKPVGKGTGLGLSVSYGIIDSLGGTIGHHGNDWGGATFFFELPAVDSPEGANLKTNTPAAT